MRATSSDTNSGAIKRRALLFAALLLAALCVLAISLAGNAPAETLQEKLESTQRQARRGAGQPAALAETIAEQNTAIDSMIGEVSALRQKRAAVEAELAEKQAELERRDEGARSRRTRTPRRGARRSWPGRSASLRERLVAIYEAGSPDVVNAILESEDWYEMAAQTEYLNRIQSYDDSVVERVKTLRDEVTRAVGQLDRDRDEDRRSARLGRRHRAGSRRRQAEAPKRASPNCRPPRPSAAKRWKRSKASEEALSRQPLLDLQPDRLRRRRHRRARPRRCRGAAQPGEEAQVHQRKRSQRASAAPAGGQGRDLRRPTRSR